MDFSYTRRPKNANMASSLGAESLRPRHQAMRMISREGGFALRPASSCSAPKVGHYSLSPYISIPKSIEVAKTLHESVWLKIQIDLAYIAFCIHSQVPMRTGQFGELLANGRDVIVAGKPKIWFECELSKTARPEETSGRWGDGFWTLTLAKRSLLSAALRIVPIPARSTTPSGT